MFPSKIEMLFSGRGLSPKQMTTTPMSATPMMYKIIQGIDSDRNSTALKFTQEYLHPLPIVPRQIELFRNGPVIQEFRCDLNQDTREFTPQQLRPPVVSHQNALWIMDDLVQPYGRLPPNIVRTYTHTVPVQNIHLAD